MPSVTEEPPTWHDAIERYLRHLQATGQSRDTVYLRRAQLYRLARDVGFAMPSTVTLTGVEEWLASRVWAPETRRSHAAALKRFYGWLLREELIERNPVEALKVPGISRPNPRPVPESAYAFALQVADPLEWLMVRLAGEAGLRRGEVAKVHSRDVVEDLLGWSLVVHGKGGKERTVPLKADLARALRARGEGYLFPGRIDGHMSPAWVAKRVQRLLPDGYSMHKLRHRFGSKAYAVSGDLAAVQDLLGHESPVTTRIYVKVPDGPKRAIVDAV